MNVVAKRLHVISVLLTKHTESCINLTKTKENNI